MRSRFMLAAFALAAVTSGLAAQSPLPKPKPQLPNPLADTVIVSSLSLANGATFASAPISLNHQLLGGKKPSHYRASKYADFHDVQWITYPTTVPNFSGSGSGACGANFIKIVAHFQVRAPKVIQNEGGVIYLHSNVARDTTCLSISG